MPLIFIFSPSPSTPYIYTRARKMQLNRVTTSIEKQSETAVPLTCQQPNSFAYSQQAVTIYAATRLCFRHKCAYLTP
ncbi:hypothetical protein HMPREF1991_01816 [Hoylesella loescheii DSM 19665 = JCM 12249 = ATCC 15930]|uniref:Uncharacterized protein n=1 Tax=Hoylesella loescheii DSM 19665 = JCM 12249 = ATCC 15930 TaxID=1122985 RepID=A0A069QHF1_HOYLO|nr:hypothetical protein HMPREF1991_01816 [Hoylesella loescheii DSM 19665 = JCM 12249 = ATCC 15930]